jgi:hypothetical protein
MATTGTVELAQTARIASMASQLHSTKEDLQDVAVTDEDKGKCANRTITTRVAQGVAGASIVLNIVAMALSFSGFTLVAGIVALIIAPIVIMQQFALQDTGSTCYHVTVYRCVSFAETCICPYYRYYTHAHCTL